MFLEIEGYLQFTFTLKVGPPCYLTPEGTVHVFSEQAVDYSANEGAPCGWEHGGPAQGPSLTEEEFPMKLSTLGVP